MAIFGLFGKKNDQATSSKKDLPRTEVRGRTTVLPNQSQTPQTLQRNVDRAQATARKIDAIESEMSSEFTTTQAANSTLPSPATVLPPPAFPSSRTETSSPNQLGRSFEATLPIMGMSTELLLGEEGKSGSIEVAATDSAQVYEEVAILFANNQLEMAEQLLRDTLAQEEKQGHSKHGHSARQPWWMLFDLYQVTGNHEAFENLSLDYMRLFETSPPAWQNLVPLDAQSAKGTRGGSRPTVIFPPKLDNSITKTLERALKQAENHPALRLEFSRVAEVDAIGCGLLLRLLKRLQKSEHELMLVDAEQLASKVRATLQVGRKEDTEVPWLLLLEVLRLMNREKDFEEVSMDYCVTFEVSPPPFIASTSKVTQVGQTASPSSLVAEDKISMPAVIEGKAEPIVSALQELSKRRNRLLVDCSSLHRIDFAAAGQLLSGLSTLTAEKKTVEFQQLNHLVATLFEVMGYKDLATLVPRKY